MNKKPLQDNSFMYNESMDFTKIVKKILKKSGMTEHELAKKIKISQPTINRIKNNPGYNIDYKVGMALIRIKKEL